MIRWLVLALVLALLPGRALADDNRPLTIAVTNNGAGRYTVDWKVPGNLTMAFLPDLIPPQGCAREGRERRWSDTIGYWGEIGWRCTRPLGGGTIGIAWPHGAIRLPTIVRLKHRGTEDTLLGQLGETRIAIPAVPQQENLFLKFLRLGIEHIWTGVDHLLFVAGLIFVASTWRRMAVTITGFTVAHSFTLALAALGLVRLPPGAVEAVIALSIVFLAVEIAKGPRDTLTWRQPVAVAASFGLLHGFGFAAVLRQVGLPQQGLVTALFAFNLGIEVGQVIFAALVFALLALLHRLPALGHPQRVQRVAAYAVGILASYWMFQRLS